MHFTAAVITVSDRGARGERTDTSGPKLCALLRERGLDPESCLFVGNDPDTDLAVAAACGVVFRMGGA